MKRSITLLSILLVVQICAALALNIGREEYGATEPEEALLAVSPDEVDTVRIESPDTVAPVVIKYQDGRWTLPEHFGFPAAGERVRQLVQKISGLKKGWPVATTPEAAGRFKVADDKYERKITLSGKERVLDTLYLGTSPGFRKVYARAGKEREIFSVDFAVFEAGAENDDWIDKDILKIRDTDINRLEMDGICIKRTEDKALTLCDAVAGEETIRSEAASLLNRIANLRIQSVLGKKPMPEFKLDNPELVISIDLSSGGELTYRLSRPENGDHYILKASGWDYYFSVPGWSLESIKNTKRNQLIRGSHEPDSGNATGKR